MTYLPTKKKKKKKKKNNKARLPLNIMYQFSMPTKVISPQRLVPS